MRQIKLPLIFAGFLLFLLSGTPSLVAKSNETIPIEKLYQLYENIDVKISPDGKTLIGTVYRKEKKSGRDTYAISLWKYDTGEKRIETIHSEPWTYILSYYWVDNDTIICRLWSNWRIMWVSVNIDGSFLQRVWPLPDDIENARRIDRSFSFFRFVDPLPKDENRILIELGWKEEWEKSGAPEWAEPQGLYRFNLDTLDLEFVATAPSSTRKWLLDAEGQPVVHYGYNFHMLEAVEGVQREKIPEFDFESFRQLHRFENGEWIPISDLDISEDEFTPGYVEKTGNGFYFLSRYDADKVSVYYYSFEKGLREKPLLSPANADISYISGDTWTNTFAYALSEYLTPTRYYFESSMGTLHEQLKGLFPKTDFHLRDWDVQRKKFIIRSNSNRNAGEFFLLDTEKGSLLSILKLNPWIDNYPLGAVQPIEIPARDGLKLPSYLTTPPGKSIKDGPMPLILNVHGGPWSRDNYDFDPFVQLLATRGFAVLQVNFRGSTGFGLEFEEEAKMNFGKKMYDDLVDAVSWAIEEKVTEQGMIGIAGISYGGYATLQGLIRDPELFEFGIYINGTTDLVEQIEHWRRENKYWAYQKWIEFAGDPENPEELQELKKASPIYNIEKIEDPLFLYYGLRDNIIPFENQKNLTRLLKHHGKEFERLYHRDEGHNPFSDIENRIELAGELEKFLKKQLRQMENN